MLQQPKETPAARKGSDSGLGFSRKSRVFTVCLREAAGPHLPSTENKTRDTSASASPHVPGEGSCVLTQGGLQVGHKGWVVGPSPPPPPREQMQALPPECRAPSFCVARKRLSRLQVSGLRGGVIAVISFRGELWLEQEMSRRAICSPQTSGHHGFSFSLASGPGLLEARGSQGRPTLRSHPSVKGPFPTLQSPLFHSHCLFFYF